MKVHFVRVLMSLFDTGYETARLGYGDDRVVFVCGHGHWLQLLILLSVLAIHLPL